MKKGKKTYSISQLASATFMILALLWLTISAPFVYASQQDQSGQDKVSNNNGPLNSTEEESPNPFGDSTEEKAPSSNSLSEEYLHHHLVEDCFFSVSSQYHKCENADTYTAFHGEVQVPPPNA